LQLYLKKMFLIHLINLNLKMRPLWGEHPEGDALIATIFRAEPSKPSIVKCSLLFIKFTTSFNKTFFRAEPQNIKKKVAELENQLSSELLNFGRLAAEGGRRGRPRIFLKMRYYNIS